MRAVTEIGFDFHDAGGKKPPPWRTMCFLPDPLSDFLADQHRAQQFARHPARIAAEERTIERTNRRSLP